MPAKRPAKKAGAPASRADKGEGEAAVIWDMLFWSVRAPDGEELDETQIRAWLRQAAKPPGWGKV